MTWKSTPRTASGEGVFALPVAALVDFLKQLPNKPAKMEKVSVCIAYNGGYAGEGQSVRLVAAGGCLAEPLETLVDIYPAEFPDLERLFMVKGTVEYVEDVGRISLSAETLFKIAMLGKPIKWAENLPSMGGQSIRFSYAQNVTSPVMFSTEGPYACYGLAMPMMMQWEGPESN